MMKKFLTRSLILAAIGILGYFAFISKSSVTIPIEDAQRPSDQNQEKTKGKNVHFIEFDPTGKQIFSGSSEEVNQIETESFELEQVSGVYTDGDHSYRIQADFLKQLDEQTRVLSAKPEGTIELAMEDGLNLNTQGPLIQSSEHLFSTEAFAQFSLSDASGRCKGMRYKRGELLELKQEAFFKVKDEQGTLIIFSDNMYFRNALGKGSLKNAVMTSINDHGESVTLAAEEIEISFTGGDGGAPFRITRAILKGKPSSLIWGLGRLESSYFDVCFDGSGKWLEELITDGDAQFAMVTQDNYDVYGNSGMIDIAFRQSTPVSMVGRDTVRVEAQKFQAPPLSLKGSQGIKTEFYGGKAHSTQINGNPSFQYGEQRGQGGTLQLLHHEHNLILSGEARLLAPRDHIEITGDKILLTNWDQRKREIFAFEFVTIKYGEYDEDRVECFGDHLELRLPERYVKIEGKPARTIRQGQQVAAKQIEFLQLDQDLYDLRTQHQVHLTMDMEEGLLEAFADTMRFESATQKLQFGQVTKASFPALGELSCTQLEAFFKEKNDVKVIEKVIATGNVILEGQIEQNGSMQPIACQADKLNYQPAKNEILVLGQGRDISFEFWRGKAKGRELTFNLKDGSMRVGPVAHGTTQTTVNVKELKKDNRR